MRGGSPSPLLAKQHVSSSLSGAAWWEREPLTVRIQQQGQLPFSGAAFLECQ